MDGIEHLRHLHRRAVQPLQYGEIKKTFLVNVWVIDLGRVEKVHLLPTISTKFSVNVSAKHSTVGGVNVNG